MPQVSAGRCPSTSVVVAAHFAQPPIDGLLAGGDAGIADARVFGECAFLVVANGPDMYAVAVALEKQAVACSNAQEPADFDGHGDLSFARDLRLLLHGDLRFLTLS